MFIFITRGIHSALTNKKKPQICKVQNDGLVEKTKQKMVLIKNECLKNLL